MPAILGPSAYGSRQPNLPYYQGAFSSVATSSHGSGPRGGPVAYQGIPVPAAAHGRLPCPTQLTSYGGLGPSQASTPGFGMPQSYFPTPFASLPGKVAASSTYLPVVQPKNATPQAGGDSKTPSWPSPETSQNIQTRTLPAPSGKVTPSPGQHTKHSSSFPHPPSRSPVNTHQSHPPPHNLRMGVAPYPTYLNGAQGHQQAWLNPSTPLCSGSE